MGKQGFRQGWRELLFQQYTPFWLIPVLYMYIVEDGLGDKLTKRLELEINKKGRKKGKQMNIAVRLINCVVNGHRHIRRNALSF